MTVSPPSISESQAIQAVQTLGRRISIYRPLKAASAYHQSNAKYRFIFGGNRSGKSEAAIGYDASTFALGIHDNRKTPQYATIWIATETWDMVGKIIWEEKLRDYLPPFQIAQIVWHNKQRGIPNEIRLKNGNVIELKAYEQGYEKFQGRAIDAAYCDEQMPQNIFTEIQARLMDRNGYFSLSATPIKPQRWLEDRIATAHKTDFVQYANLEDNRKSRGGYLDDSEIDGLIAEWPEETRVTRVDGHFGSYQGAVYKTFNRNDHVVDRIPFEKSHYHYRSIDFGFNNPFVCLWGFMDSDRCWWIYKEHFKAQELLAFHASKIINNTNGYNIKTTYSDHDAQGRAELRSLGINTRAARKEVNEGIEKVQQALKVQENGEPRLRIHSSCKNLIREFAGYRYPEGTDTRDAKDEPMKLDDHTLDALRYMIYTTERKGVGLSFG